MLRTQIQTDAYAAGGYPQLDYLLASVLYGEKSGRAAVFALNCSPDEDMSVAVELRGLGGHKIIFASELQHPDLKTSNTKLAPKSQLRAKLRPLSWNVFVTERA